MADLGEPPFPTYQSKNIYTVPPTDFGYEVMALTLSVDTAALEVDQDDAVYSALFWADDVKACHLSGKCNNSIRYDLIYESHNRGVLSLKDGSLIVTHDREISLIPSSGNGTSWSNHFNDQLYKVAQSPHDGRLYIAAGAQICTAELSSPAGSALNHLTIYDIVNGSQVPASFKHAYGVAFHPDGDLYVVDYDDHSLWRVDLKTNIRSKIDLVHSEASGLAFPADLCIDISGRIFIAEWDGNRIWCVAGEGQSRQAKVISSDANAPAIFMDHLGRIYYGSETEIRCLVPDTPQPSGYDCARFGISKSQ